MRLIAAIWLRNKPQYVGRVDGARMTDRGMGGWGPEEGVGGVHPNTPHKAGLLRLIAAYCGLLRLIVTYCGVWVNLAGLKGAAGSASLRKG